MDSKLLFVFAAATSVQAFVPNAFPRAAATTRRVGPVVLANPIMDFFESLMPKEGTQEKTRGQVTVDEATELCRDPDSTGCTVEMLDMIPKHRLDLERKAAAARGTPQPTFSEEIDDAIVKTE